MYLEIDKRENVSYRLRDDYLVENSENEICIKFKDYEVTFYHNQNLIMIDDISIDKQVIIDYEVDNLYFNGVWLSRHYLVDYAYNFVITFPYLTLNIEIHKDISENRVPKIIIHNYKNGDVNE